MCGIGGWLGNIPEAPVYSKGMLRSLHHRGPDGQGLQSWADATLVHTRLSIIDLSPTGSQPMPNEDGTIWTVFNGEIYNHRQLRRELELKGHRFRGQADTEILPHLYEEEGREFVARLRGMFAFAIYDLRNKTLLLARDRFGIKPLFYSLNSDCLMFASEINALLELPNVDARPNRQAIHDFAALFYIPAPETFYTGIHALQAGESLEATLTSNQISCKPLTYHRWKPTLDRSLTLNQSAERAEALIFSAVQSQMESDVPLGALLSGGIDSSLVSAAAQESLSGTLRTFNVRFSEKEYDETWAAEAVANKIGSTHETLEMDHVRGDWDYVTTLLRQAGQPFADVSIFAANAVCRLMRSHVKVALSGDGGDEGFGGYDFYQQIATIVRCQRIPRSMWQVASIALPPLANLRLLPERLPQRIQELTGADNTTVIQTLFCWLREKEHRDLVRCGDVQPIRRLFEPRWEQQLPRGASRLEHLSIHATEANVRLSLPNDFLFKVDTASMKESLEVRVPMLDEDLFSFGLSLPHRLKVKGGMCKRVLRAVASRRLPAAVANKPKWGFVVPFMDWVDMEFKDRLKDALLGSSSKLPEFFEPKVYQPMVEAFCAGRSCQGISREGLYNRAIMFLSLQLALCRTAK